MACSMAGYASSPPASGRTALPPSSRNRLTRSPSTFSEANCGPEMGATSTGKVSTCSASTTIASSRCCDSRVLRIRLMPATK
ncbi:hypothetical protein D3C71_1318270 [compost metagenome]